MTMVAMLWVLTASRMFGEPNKILTKKKNPNNLISEMLWNFEGRRETTMKIHLLKCVCNCFLMYKEISTLLSNKRSDFKLQAILCKFSR